MEELTKTEERIMQIFWKLKSAFVKDIIDELDEEPKPPYNTISSIQLLIRLASQKNANPLVHHFGKHPVKERIFIPYVLYSK